MAAPKAASSRRCIDAREREAEAWDPMPVRYNWKGWKAALCGGKRDRMFKIVAKTNSLSVIEILLLIEVLLECLPGSLNLLSVFSCKHDHMPWRIRLSRAARNVHDFVHILVADRYTLSLTVPFEA